MMATMSLQKHPDPITFKGRVPSAAGIAHKHFNVHNEAPHRQLLTWRESVGHIIDVLPSAAQAKRPFSASIDHYAVGDVTFTDCRSDAMLLERSVARISTDNIRAFAFQVFETGSIQSVADFYPKGLRRPSGKSILALDMNQPVRMQRNACQVLTLFIPRAQVEAAFPDADSIHGRILEDGTPLTRLLVEHVLSLNRNMPTINAGEAQNAMRVSTELLVAAFGQQMQLSGNARAAVRSATFGQVRRQIQLNLHQAHLSPESLINTLQLSRATLYRMFEHEGGLAAYIRNCRLRAAADELVKFPHVAVVDVAYGLGFKSASDFSRSFRRAYAMTPQDLRAYGTRGSREKH